MKTLTVSSDKCPYRECDGTGVIINLYSDDSDRITRRCKICRCREDRSKRIYESLSSIPYDYKDCTIKNFEIDCYTDIETISKIKKACINFIKNYDEFSRQGKGLYFYSKTKGSGKTRMACSLGNALIRHLNMNVKFTTTLNLLDLIKDTYNYKSTLSEKELMDKYKGCKILILDDIGTETPTDWVCGKFLDLLDCRIHNKLVTIFTSNISINELNLDGRIVDRIYKMAIEFKFPEESIRKVKASVENIDLNKLLGL